MIEYLARRAQSLVNAAIAPVEAAGTRFVGMLASTAGFATLAVACLIGTVIFLSIALDMWLTQLAGPIIGALGAAGLYLFVAVVSLILLVRRRSTSAAASKKNLARALGAADNPEAAPASEFSAGIEETVAPFVAILKELGMKREEVVVRLAAEASKQIGPLTLVGLALVVGFLAERSFDKPRKSG
jgi:hypothetical protein